MTAPSNFAFLASEWPEVLVEAKRAEEYARNDTRSSCFYSRRAMELAIHWMYANDRSLAMPYDDSLSTLMHDAKFRNLVDEKVWPKMNLIRKFTNKAIHEKKPVPPDDAVHILSELFHILYWLARTYSRKPDILPAGAAFNLSLVPEDRAAAERKTAEQFRALQDELQKRDEEVRQQNEELAAKDEAIRTALVAHQQAVAAAKVENAKVKDSHDYSEAETRRYIIDVLLKEAGWNLDGPDDKEYEVHGMPNTQELGYVDYVLWGADGKPLAVVEAKRTTKDATVGKQQAFLYAECLEKKFGRLPAIFYTNGYQTWLWDKGHYPPRRVQGFYKRDELELLIQQRDARKPLGAEPINEKIVGRPFQKECIRRIGEHFEKQQRKALAVMATGSGKTRTAIALCDLLQRCNWAKRILFLADRVALVNQAVNAFKAHLPDTSPVNLVTERGEKNSRVYVCTYPTMMNLIEEYDGETRRFGSGYFDLIIIDEAHRSVYQKYRAIFEYFDSFLLGLTATPKAEVDRNTYSLFELEQGVPTFAYELEDAVKDGYLVPVKKISVPLKFQREGIKYDDLSEEEKEQWDALDWPQADASGNVEIPREVDPAALNKWLFNKDTVDKVLAHLMEHGIKVAGGDRLGKTIIFAKNHKHALFIQEQFDINYPHYKGEFSRVIDNYETYAQSLLDSFSIPSKAPHIAISIDMLDTGIDIPEIVNLVFFKMVRSRTKFTQMIGRGTRLRPDLFGPGQNKTHFIVFDYCMNFEFFNENPEGIEGKGQKSLSQRLFEKRLDLLEVIPSVRNAGEDLKGFGESVAGELHGRVVAMNCENFIVRPHRSQVEKFAKIEVWGKLGPQEIREVRIHLSGLPTEIEDENETAKWFDLTVIGIQDALLRKLAYTKSENRVRQIASKLEGKGSIPTVKKWMALILELQTDAYWQDITAPILEVMRVRLRELVQFIDKSEQKIVYTDFEDEIGRGTIVGENESFSGVDVERYRKKVMNFLKAHENHITLQKLRLNRPLTPTDIAELERFLFESSEIGSREEFEKVFGMQASLGLFVRSLVGLDRAAAKEAFALFLDNSRYTANQIRFVSHIIDHLTRNGTMETRLLYETPYTDYSPEGVDGVFGDQEAGQICEILEQVRRRAAG